MVQQFINSLNDLSLDKKLLNAWFENRLRLEIVHASDLSLSLERRLSVAGKADDIGLFE